jgi:hypothetical protein
LNDLQRRLAVAASENTNSAAREIASVSGRPEGCWGLRPTYSLAPCGPLKMGISAEHDCRGRPVEAGTWCSYLRRAVFGDRSHRQDVPALVRSWEASAEWLSLVGERICEYATAMLVDEAENRTSSMYPAT